MHTICSARSELGVCLNQTALKPLYYSCQQIHPAFCFLHHPTVAMSSSNDTPGQGAPTPQANALSNMEDAVMLSDYVAWMRGEKGPKDQVHLCSLCSICQTSVLDIAPAASPFHGRTTHCHRYLFSHRVKPRRYNRIRKR